jgi:hypothetical protein
MESQWRDTLPKHSANAVKNRCNCFFCRSRLDHWSPTFMFDEYKNLSTEIVTRVDPTPFSMKAIACTITPKLFILQMELFPRTWIMMPTLPRYSDHSRRSTLGQGAIGKIKKSKID